MHLFEHLIGNTPAKLLISRLLSSGRFPNAVLFAGPHGIGKRAFALATAQAFVCGSDGCGACSACRRAIHITIPKPDKRDDFKEVIFTAHADVGIVAPHNRTIFVDAIRKLEAEARFRPFEARSRVFIIDNADAMNEAASNALLKTLEEPAQTSHIILVTARPDSMLPTILSRCQTIRFTPVSADEITTALVRTGKFAASEASLAARLSNGSVARALATDVEKVKLARDAMISVIDNAVNGRASANLQLSEYLNDAKNKEDFEANLAILESIARDIWLLNNGLSRDSLANIDIAERLEALSKRLANQVLAEWLEEIEAIRGRFVFNINRRIATDALFVKMAA